MTFLFWYYLGDKYGDPAKLTERFNQIVLWYLSFLWFIPIVFTIIQRYLYPEQRWQSLLLKHILMLIAFFVFYSFSAGGVIFLATGKLVNSTNYFAGVLKVMEINSWPYDYTMYATIVLSAYVHHYFSEARLKQTQNRRLELELYKTQLNALRSQLNPHFIFNALNTVSGLVRLNEKEKATHAIAELSYMLRTVLEVNDKHLIRLVEEITFIRRYLHFQTLRFGERLKININIDQSAENAKVPFLLLHTLVENAVKHGSQFSTENHIDLKATAKDNILQIHLINSAGNGQHNDGFGIGLLNSHKRLQWLFKDNYLLESRIDEEKRYHTHIEIKGEH